MTDTDKTEPAQTRPFADVLWDLDQGRLSSELADKLQDLLAAVQETGKKGTLALRLTLAPSKSEAPFEVIPDVAVKLPAATRKAALFFADADHNLVRRNPAQQELPLRDVKDDGPKNLREAR